MTNADQTGWTKRSGKQTPEKPRFAFEGHMAVFATNDVRHSLTPGRISPKGFDSFADHIYVATPEEMRPENHEVLKAKLNEKVAEAMTFPYSPSALESLQHGFFRAVTTRVIDHHPIEFIEYFSQHHQPFREKYNADEYKQSIQRDLQQDTFNPYPISDMFHQQYPEGKDAYLDIKKFMRQHGMKKEVEKIELECAQSLVQHLLIRAHIPKEEKDTLLHQIITTTTDDNGRSKVKFHPKPLEKLYRHILQNTYADMDATINQARDTFVAEAKWRNIPDPFSYTEQEQATIRRIDQIAHADTRVKPVTLAGYEDKDLTIIVEPELNSVYYGRSYPGQNMIVMVDNPKTVIPFESTMTEELLHQGLDKIYQNQSLPYINDEDPRKALLEKALEQDINSPYDLMMLMIAPSVGYNVDNQTVIHQEAPVKAMKLMDDETGQLMWNRNDPNKPDLLTNLEYYVNEVIVKDAVAYNHGRPLQHIDMDYQRSGASHGRQAADRKQDSGTLPPL
jgi:hypothetical protein